jgi:uncharacterized membrane protein YedE/YeeE
MFDQEKHGMTHKIEERKQTAESKKLCAVACAGTLLSALFLLPAVRTGALAIMQMLIGRPLNEYAYWQWQFMWLAVGGITFFGIIAISETAWFAKLWNRANTADPQKFTGGGGDTLLVTYPRT